MGSEAMNHKTQDDVYGGRLITAKNNQSETRTPTPALYDEALSLLESNESHTKGERVLAMCRSISEG